MASYFIGVDVGTGSARAGVFDADGRMLGVGEARHHALPRARRDRRAVERRDLARRLRRRARRDGAGAASRRTTSAASASTPPARWSSSGRAARPLPVGPTEDPARDIIVWMDHRAVDQADRINAGGHAVLRLRRRRASRPRWRRRSCSGSRRTARAVFDAAWQFFDLTDFLTWRATGSLARSSCTVTCKWTYLAHERRWDADYFRADRPRRAGRRGLRAHRPESSSRARRSAPGLTDAAAADSASRPGPPVAAGLIDAHAGGIGTVGARRRSDVRSHGLCLRHLGLHDDDHRRPGLRAGRLGALLLGDGPGRLAERGRPVGRRRRDRPSRRLPPGVARGRRARRGRRHSRSPEWLADRAAGVRRPVRGGRRSPDGLHVVPEFLGNRAPFADPHARAVIAGLGMERDLDIAGGALRRRPLRPRLRPAPDRRDPSCEAARRSTPSPSAAAPAAIP